MVGPLRLPALHKTLHRIIGTSIAFRLQALKQPSGRPALAFRQSRFDLRPPLQLRPELAELGGWLISALVDRLLHLFERFANRRTGKPKIAGNRADALTPQKMAPSDFGYEFHLYHPGLLRQKRRILAQLRGGKNSTLITPDPW